MNFFQEEKETEISLLTKQLLEKEIFSPLDLMVAQSLYPTKDAFFFLLCYLSLAQRIGHSFIKKKSEQIFPEPNDLFFESTEYLTRVRSILIDGFSYCKNNCLPPGIIIEGDSVYFERSFSYEQSIINHYNRLQNDYLDFEGDIDVFTSLVEKGFENKEITSEQKEIILSLSKRKISSVSGGPGTGKTYTIGKFLKWLILSKKSSSISILLAGPTGKATANLENSMKSSLSSVYGNSDIPPDIRYEAKTLHALLKIRRFSPPPEIHTTLPYDYIIVDEASMIDLQLMSYLLSSIHRSRLIFLGDPWQLPPIDVGAPFKDFVEIEKEDKPLNLTTCLRTKIADIQLISSLVKDGYANEVLALLEKNENNNSTCGVSFKRMDISQSSLLEMATTYCSQQFEKQFRDQSDPVKLMQRQLCFRLLSPLKDGNLGISSLNKKIKAYLENVFQNIFVPIIITQNDYQLNLMNGEIGFSYGNKAYFTDRTLNSVREIPLILLSHYDLAYSLSVHKSQGSEFDHVVVFLPPGSTRFGRKMLYTALTRSRKKVEIWSDLSTIESIIKNDETRLSSIIDGVLAKKRHAHC